MAGRTTDRPAWTMVMWAQQATMIGWVIAECAKALGRRVPAPVRKGREFAEVCGGAADAVFASATNIADLKGRYPDALRAAIAAAESRFA